MNILKFIDVSFYVSVGFINRFLILLFVLPFCGTILTVVVLGLESGIRYYVFRYWIKK